MPDFVVVFVSKLTVTGGYWLQYVVSLSALQQSAKPGKMRFLILFEKLLPE